MGTQGGSWCPWYNPSCPRNCPLSAAPVFRGAQSLPSLMHVCVQAAQGSGAKSCPTSSSAFLDVTQWGCGWHQDPQEPFPSQPSTPRSQGSRRDAQVCRTHRRGQMCLFRMEGPKQGLWDESLGAAAHVAGISAASPSPSSLSMCRKASLGLNSLYSTIKLDFLCFAAAVSFCCLLRGSSIPPSLSQPLQSPNTCLQTAPPHPLACCWRRGGGGWEHVPSPRDGSGWQVAAEGGSSSALAPRTPQHTDPALRRQKLY